MKRITGGWCGAGEHPATWHHTDKNGGSLANEVQLLHFRGEGIRRTRKLVLLP